MKRHDPPKLLSAAEEGARLREEWAKHAWVETEPTNPGARRACAALSNDRVRPDVPELMFWQELVVQGIEDISGRGQYSSRVCEDCHFNATCDCVTITFKKAQIVETTKTLIKVRLPQPCYPKSRNFHRSLPISCVEEIEPGLYKYKFTRTACSKAHTNQWCAKRWFATPDFEDCCNLLGLDVSYMRKMIAA